MTERTERSKDVGIFAVRIVLDKGQKAAERLGPGMSVIATVHTKE